LQDLRESLPEMRGYLSQLLSEINPLKRMDDEKTAIFPYRMDKNAVLLDPVCFYADRCADEIMALLRRTLV
jgi:hypothetical protein